MNFRYVIAFLSATVLFINGCDVFEQRNRTFNDDPLIEFFPTSETLNESALDDSGEDAVSVPIEIQLIGPQRDTDLQVSFSANTDTSLSGSNAEVAEEGVHYNLPSTNATISSGSSQTTVNVEVLNNDVDDGGTDHVLFLDLQDSGEVAAAENLDTHVLTIRGADE